MLGVHNDHIGDGDKDDEDEGDGNNDDNDDNDDNNDNSDGDDEDFEVEHSRSLSDVTAANAVHDDDDDNDGCEVKDDDDEEEVNHWCLSLSLMTVLRLHPRELTHTAANDAHDDQR